MTWRCGRAKAVVACVLFALLAGSVRADLPSLPVEQWRWDGDTRDPARPFPYGTAVVVQATDDNADTLIDANDMPDVAFLHWGFGFLDAAALTVLDGATGVEHFTVIDPAFSTFSASGSTLAAGDLDGDGLVEFAVSSSSSLIVFENDGTLAFTRPWPAALSGSGASIGIADLNQDGVPEVTFRARVMSVDGSLTWAGAAPGGPASISSFGQVADLRPDIPGLELVAGRTCYSATGAVLWTQPAAPDGATALGDLDGDTIPEVVVAGRDQRSLWVLDNYGNLRTPAVPLVAPAQSETQPVLADLDADGLPEVLQPAGLMLQAFDWVGGTLVPMWQAPYEDGSCCSDATAFDFDGDGYTEIVFRDQRKWGIVNGCNGDILYTDPSVSATAMEGPVVANIDHDPAAEIIVSGLQGVGANLNAVVAYEVPGSRTPRSIWNQKTYHVTNVEDDGSIPRFEAPPWEANRSWHAQVGSGPARVFDLTAAWASDPLACNSGLLVEWEAPSATAGVTFDIFRSDDQGAPTCADALARAPVATGLTGTSWFDSATLPNGRHAYVVRATLRTDCAVLQSELCTADVLDVADQPAPDGVFAVLRAAHVGDEVTFLWPSARGLLAGEHFHLLKATGSPRVVFVRANPETDLALAHTETDVSSWLQFFDLRVANECEVESADEYP